MGMQTPIATAEADLHPWEPISEFASWKLKFALR